MRLGKKTWNMYVYVCLCVWKGGGGQCIRREERRRKGGRREGDREGHDLKSFTLWSVKAERFPGGFCEERSQRVVQLLLEL